MISVVIPAYNAERWLAGCLDSVMEQAIPEMEVIVVNDGSTDSTPDIAARYPGVKTVTTPNRGLAAARNEGIEASTRKWITFVDSDDRLLPGALRAMLDTASSTKALIIGGEIVRTLSVAIPQEYKTDVMEGREALLLMLYQTRYPFLGSMCGKIYDRSLFERERFTSGLYYEDLELSSRLFHKPIHVAMISRPVYLYYNNPSSFVNTFSGQRFDALRTAQIIMKRCNTDPELSRAALSRRLSANFNMLGLVLANGMPAEYAYVADACYKFIQTNRRKCFADKRSRLKNKIGILLSYLPKPIFYMFMRREYRKK